MRPGRAPQHGEDRDIFERLYAVRLDRIRAQPDCRDLVAPLDVHGLLAAPAGVSEEGVEFMDDESLLAELGIPPGGDSDITKLRHVKSREEIRAAEDVANRTPCADFETFKPLFAAVRKDLEAGIRGMSPVALGERQVERARPSRRAISCVDTDENFSRIISRASRIPIRSAGIDPPLGLPKGRPDQANGGARQSPNDPGRDHSGMGGAIISESGGGIIPLRGATSSRNRGAASSGMPTGSNRSRGAKGRRGGRCGTCLKPD